MQGETTVIKKRSRGLGCCELNKSNKLLMNLFLIIAILFLVPFIVVDLVLVWQEDISICFDRVWASQETVFLFDVFQYDFQTRIKHAEYASFSLRQWMFNDAYIKLGMLAIAIFLYALRQEAYDHRRVILSTFGISFQLYWVFEIGWLISAAVKFWADTDKKNCGKRLGNYLWARLIIGFVLIIAGLVIYSFRSKERDYRLSDHELVVVQPTTERHLVKQ